ncbi:MAG: DUF3108 domain-containing protein [Flavobacteriales bacterium]
MKRIAHTLKITSLLAVSLLISGSANAFSFSNPTAKSAVKTKKFRSIKHKAFKAGEKLTYRLHYGFVDAGEAVLQVKNTTKKVKGRSLLHVVGTGRTLGSFNWVFKVKDRYESYIDSESVFPWMFIRRVDEGGFKINQDYIFKQNENKVKTQDKKEFKVTPGIQDMLSSFYYARTIDFSKAKKNQDFAMDMFIDNEIFPFKIKYLGIETIKTRKGKFECIKLRPLMMKGRVWETEDSMTIWITNDNNKVPVLVKTKIAVGSVKATLTKWEGLVSPLKKK